MATAKALACRAAAVALAVVLAAGRASAQDEVAGVDDLEPGVDTSAVLPSVAPEPEGDDGATGKDAGDEDAAGEDEAAEEVTRVESGGKVMDRMELGRTEITGNQELPKVLYIVPWQKAQHGDLSGKPINTLLDEVLMPVDREEFIRTVDYYEELYGEKQYLEADE